MLLHEQLLPLDFKFIADFEMNPPSTRFDPATGQTVVGRPTAVFGEDFEYAGQKKIGRPWQQSLIMSYLKNHIEKETGYDIKTCLVGYYPDGNAGIDAHFDVMGENGVIVNLSFGAPRIFRLHWINQRMGETTDYVLLNGQSLSFDAEANRAAQHSVPPQAGNVGPRWSLTFRTTTK